MYEVIFFAQLNLIINLIIVPYVKQDNCSLIAKIYKALHRKYEMFLPLPRKGGILL